MNLYWSRVLSEEMTDVANLVFIAGFSMMHFKDWLSEFFLFFGDHEWQIAGFIFLILSVIKKIYDIKTHRDKYLKQKRSTSGENNKTDGTGGDGDIGIDKEVDKEEG